MTFEDIFMQQNGGKGIDDSNLDSETFTAQFCKIAAELWQAENLKRIAELEAGLKFFTLLNEDHYKDIAGGIKKAKEITK